MRPKVSFLFVLSFFTMAVVSGQSSSKTVMISGMVVDSNNEPVKGALILVDNIKTSKVTSSKGLYKVKISSDAKMVSVFSETAGMRDAVFDGNTTINFTLPGPQNPDNGNKQYQGFEGKTESMYGMQATENKSSNFNKIEGSYSKNVNYQNVYEMLTGTVPGVVVNGKKITIRGQSSLYNTSGPLFVVDGVIVSSIDDIRPIDVKFIEVVKASAAAIYGSRGSNGVIVITRYLPSDKR
jgi:TonB-dependent SusC/RagA subfamily outer membrane receptor